MKKPLIVTFHDFGISHSVNQSFDFIKDHPNNIIIEYSLLPVTPRALEGAKIAKDNPDYSFNLCMAFTSFKPIRDDHKTLIDKNGNFLLSHTPTWDFSILDTYDQEEINREIEAQYEWFVENVGRKPTALCTQSMATPRFWCRSLILRDVKTFQSELHHGDGFETMGHNHM